jgi:hypothetical protein
MMISTNLSNSMNLSIAFCFIYLSNFSTMLGQVELFLTDSSYFNGPIDVSYTKPTLDWGSPNMDSTENSVIGEMVLARDTSDQDSLVCYSLANPADIDGKVAVFYRGECQFGLKLLNVEAAGAIAAIIINNEFGTVEMGGGDSGLEVNIPMAMVSIEEGERIREAISNGFSNVFFGNRNGKYPFDVGITRKSIMLPMYASRTYVGDNNFPDDMPDILGAYVFNNGNMPVNDIQLKASIKDSYGTIIYQESSFIVDELLAGDSIFLELPEIDLFGSIEHYTGKYELMTIDSFPYDNTIGFEFSNMNFISYLPVNIEDGKIKTPLANTGLTNFSYIKRCIAFEARNNAQLVARTIGFAVYPFPNSGETEIEVVGEIYSWENDFSNMNDPNYELNNDALNLINTTVFNIQEEDFGKFMHHPIDTDEDEIIIQYGWSLFCLETDAFLANGIQSNLYSQNSIFHNKPLFPVYESEWFNSIKSLTNNVELIPAIAIGHDTYTNIKELLKTRNSPFPNPTNSLVNIPIMDQLENIELFNIWGEKVPLDELILQVSQKSIQIDVNNLSNGSYLLKNTYPSSFESHLIIKTD